eukprot:364186-Chlamydomonas_euryale.AAC.1
MQTANMQAPEHTSHPIYGSWQLSHGAGWRLGHRIVNRIAHRVVHGSLDTVPELPALHAWHVPFAPRHASASPSV